MANDNTMNRDNNKTELHKLFSSKTTRILTDYFCSIAPDWNPEEDKPMYKSEIAENTGLSAHSVGDHIDTLVEFGVVENVDGENARSPRYQPQLESQTEHPPVYELILEINNAAYAEKINPPTDEQSPTEE
jgi:hypothetical protein